MTYKGCVTRTWERNGPYDSDFYADCLNVETGQIDQVEYDTTRCGGCGSATVDVTEENFRLWLRAAYHKQVSECLKHNENSASLVEVGKTVKVVKGRKVPIGTVGKVFWRKKVNYDKYNRWYNATYRLGIKDDDGNVYWTNESNVEVVDPQQYKESAHEVIRKLKKRRSESYQEASSIYKWQ